MSTPSTATAIHPRQPYYYGNAHHVYPSSATTSSSSATLPYPYPTQMTTSAAPTLPPPSRQSTMAAVSAAYQPSVVAPPPSTSSSGTVIPTGRSRRKPNWAEFYKNGVPKEIIYIDDDDDDDDDHGSANHQQQASASWRLQSGLPPTATALGLNQNATVPLAHTSKRRRTGLESAFERPYVDHPSYSHLYGEDSSNASRSTDRTTSLNTSAHTSIHSTNPAPYQDQLAGQKRKRVYTRGSARDEQKRRELDAFAYVPPPNPPIKAKDVTVPIVRETHNKHIRVDDDDGHFIVNAGTMITTRYSIIKLLGQGTFGKVVEAYDNFSNSRCAVKIIRSVQKYRDASRIELRVLSTLAKNDTTNRNRCIHLRDCFDYRSHICIVTDLLGQSVFDFLKENSFVPFPSTQIQSFARQLFTSVAFLHDLNLIHTDLKPENILLVNSNYQTFTYNRTIPSSSTTISRTGRQRRVLLDSEIRLIDFGSATFDDEYHSSVVSTRHYRAPEIILNLGWSFPCDIWSIGCILVEFFTGDALFQTHDNLEHLAMMESVCSGKLDAKLVRQVTQRTAGGQNQAAKYFVRNKLDYPNAETSRASRKYVKAMKGLHEFIPSSTTFHKQFLDLLRRIFVYDPKQRITAREALNHPWFRETLQDDGTEAQRLLRKRQEQEVALRR